MTKTVAVGALFGVGVALLSAMPLFGMCCCIWAIAGGLGAVYAARYLGEEQTVFSGALAGFAGGVVATLLITSCVGAQLTMTGGLDSPQFRQALEQQTPEAREIVENLGLPGIIGILFAIYGVFLGGFMTIGGAIGGAVFGGQAQGPDPDGPWQKDGHDGGHDGYGGGHDGFGDGHTSGGPESVGGPIKPDPDHLKPL